MIIKMIIRPWIIDHYFVSAIEIIAPVPAGQVGSKDPLASIEVNELPAGNVVIGFYIGQVIIIGPVVSYGPPLWLGAYVYTNAYLGSCLLGG
jgi:hypothetical protein